jgi:hypothetical protein
MKSISLSKIGGRAILAAAFVALSSCATMTKDECQTADWYKRGEQDGARTTSFQSTRDGGMQAGSREFASTAPLRTGCSRVAMATIMQTRARRI